MFEDRTTANIKKEALEELSPATGISAMAGSFADATIGAAARVTSEFYQALRAVPSMLFVDPNSGQFLDLVAGDYFSMTRRSGTVARCSMDLFGTPGTLIQRGTVFLTAEGLRFATTAAVTIGSDGRAVCELQAAENGAAYNITAGALVSMWINIPGLTSYYNTEATGGTDDESGEQLYERIDEARKRPRTSGNGWDFRGWALEIDGIGEAKIVELANGPGTVGVTLVDSTYAPASEEKVEAVLQNILLKKPIGATPTVEAAKAVEISVSAAVTLAGTTTEAVKEAFTTALQDYFRMLIDNKYKRIYYKPAEDLPYTVVYNRVLALLLTVPGVDNFSSLIVGGGEDDISIPADSIPTLGEVTVT